MIFVGSTSGYRAEMTFAVVDANAHDASRAAVIAAAFKNWWDANLKSTTTSTWSLSQIYVLDVGSATGISIVYATGLPIAGTSASPEGPANAAPIITWRTALRGRRFRGRTFIVGAPQGAFQTGDGTAIAAGYVTVYQAAATALISAIAAVAGAPQLCVASDVAAAATIITSGQARTYVGTQKRRVKAP